MFLSLHFFTDLFERFDPKGKVFLFFEFIFEIYRVIMACGLSIFVPQICYDNSGCKQKSHLEEVCSIYANTNLKCISSYNKFVLLFNILTAFSFLILYVVELKRDQWLMKHFSMNENKLLKNLEKYKDRYQLLFRKLHNYNSIYFLSYKIIAFVYFANTSFSSVLLYYNFYDSTTVTVLITNTLLVDYKILSGLYVSQKSYHTNLPICYYSKEYISYNAIDMQKKNINYFGKKITGIDSNELQKIGPFINIKRLSNAFSKTINKVYIDNESGEEKSNYIIDLLDNESGEEKSNYIIDLLVNSDRSMKIGNSERNLKIGNSKRNLKIDNSKRNLKIDNS